MTKPLDLNNQATPLLDGFLKETARLNPLRTGKTAFLGSELHFVCTVVSSADYH